MLDKAISLAAKLFEGKTDKAGKPYILHCLRVMNGVDQSDSEQNAESLICDYAHKNSAIINSIGDCELLLQKAVLYGYSLSRANEQGKEAVGARWTDQDMMNSYAEGAIDGGAKLVRNTNQFLYDYRVNY